MSASSRRLEAAVGRVKARADLPEAERLEVVDLPAEAELAVPVDPLEHQAAVDPLEQVDLLAAAVRPLPTRSSIPRMAKFPILLKLARNPMT
jgi:hypothetical protein